MSEKTRWRRKVGRYDFGKPKSPLFVTEYLKDGKILKTVHDGSFSPGGEEPYTPAPWLRVTGGEYSLDVDGQTFTFTGGSVAFTSVEEQPLQYSNDGVSWTDLNWTFDEEDSVYISEIFDLENNEQVYFRASEKIELNNAALPFDIYLGSHFDGSDLPVVFSLDGNYNSLYSPNSKDWETIIPRNNIFKGGAECVVLHMPDFPGTVLPQEAYYAMLERYFSFSVAGEQYACPVSDDGETFNFKLGITPDELYKYEIIPVATNYYMAEFLGNSQGLTPSGQCILTTSTSVSGNLENFINPTIKGLNMPYLIRIIEE